MSGRRLGLVAVMSLVSATWTTLHGQATLAGPYPVEGVVTTNGVNVRPDPSTAGAQLVFMVKGDPLLVVGKQGDWYEVKLPSDLPLWINKQYVVRGTGSAGEVQGMGVRVRDGAGTEFKELGKLNTGRKVQALSEQGEWVKFTFLPLDSGYVNAKYVRLPGEGEVPAAQVAAEEVKVLFRQAEGLYEVEVKKEKIETWDLREAEKLYRALLTRTEDAALRKVVEGRLSIIELANQYRQSMVTPEDYETRLKAREAEIAAEYEQKRREIMERPALPKYLATGRVEKLGNTWLAPATHKLMRGDQPVYLLYSDKEDLRIYEGHFVGVLGKLDASAKGAVPTVRGDDLDILDQVMDTPAEDDAK